jgi:hypothetical protein
MRAREGGAPLVAALSLLVLAAAGAQGRALAGVQAADAEENLCERAVLGHCQSGSNACLGLAVLVRRGRAV